MARRPCRALSSRIAPPLLNSRQVVLTAKVNKDNTSDLLKQLQAEMAALEAAGSNTGAGSGPAGGRRATVRVSRELSARLDLFPETIETILSTLHAQHRITLVSKCPQVSLLHMPADMELLPPLLRHDSVVSSIVKCGKVVGAKALDRTRQMFGASAADFDQALGKGAAGAAIQNLNLMLDMEETTGL